MRKHFLLGAWAIFSLLSASEGTAAKDGAMPPVPGPAVEEIPIPDVDVSASAGPRELSYEAIARGLEAFALHQQQAPAAKPQFRVRPVQQEASLKGLHLVLSTPGRNRDLPFDKNGAFTPPQLDAADRAQARIALNPTDGAFAIAPFVRTPGLAPDTLRMGDLRVGCEMRWAIAREDNDTFPLILYGPGGPCHSHLVKSVLQAPRPVSSIWLVYGQRREALPVERLKADRITFMPPIHDDSWPDDTLIELKFLEDARR
ncbi:hypothetical protein [uncultured Rhodoblastus sp.]|uniref:hypothetical protein n=1 Tax=uncultured Rhodoblastus sp. TaxID=543037 RepID=UPI0025F41279|nr:hypothetical protein [uncultured Rhodoblastus sp.]